MHYRLVSISAVYKRNVSNILIAPFAIIWRWRWWWWCFCCCTMAMIDGWLWWRRCCGVIVHGHSNKVFEEEPIVAVTMMSKVFLECCRKIWELQMQSQKGCTYLKCLTRYPDTVLSNHVRIWACLYTNHIRIQFKNWLISAIIFTIEFRKYLMKI